MTNFEKQGTPTPPGSPAEAPDAALAGDFGPNAWLAMDLLDQYRQIGNAVPVGLARAIGQLIVAHLEGQEDCQTR